MPRKVTLEEIPKDEEVLAKWPGAQLYYPGKVVDFDAVSKVYKIKFDNDSENDSLEVLQKYVSRMEVAKQWRSRSASPARSPGRGRRRRSRSKSPARVRRVAKSPARGRAKKIQESPTQENKPKEPIILQAAVEKTIDAVDGTLEFQKEETETETKTESSTTVAAEEKYVITKRVTRSVTRMQEKEKLTESPPAPSQQSATGKVGWRQQFEALVGIFVFPALLLALCLVCADKKHAFSFTEWPKIPAASAFLDWKCFLIVGLLLDLQLFLTLLPIGEVFKVEETKDGQRMEYRVNGLFLLFLNLAAFGVAVYTKHAFILANLVEQYYLKIATSCIIIAFGFTLQMMIKARWNKNLADKSFSPYNFLNGLELNPRLLKVDCKLASAKAGVTFWMLLNLCFLLNQYSAGGKKMHYPTMAVALFQLLYIMDMWFLEKSVIKSREMVHDKFGFSYAFLATTALPMFYSMQMLYMSKMSPQLTQWQWGAFIATQVIGFYIFHSSTMEKYRFRLDQKKETKREVKVVFTPDGKNLLADGWWGRLRHPNYLGDILIATSWAIPAGCSHILPWLYPILLALLLIFRAYEDDQYCAQKYGLSWMEYKSRVKYIIFPYVY